MDRASETRAGESGASPRSPRVLVAGVVAGALWLVGGGLLQAIVWFWPQGAPLVRAVLPETMRGLLWVWPQPWGVAAAIAGAVAVGAVAAVLLLLLRSRGGVGGGIGIVAAWFAVIVAGAVVGMVADVALVASSLPELGLRAAISVYDLGGAAATGAYWGVLQGWIPAVCCSARPMRTVDGAADPRASRLLAVAAATALAVLAGGGYAALLVRGSESAQVAAQQEAEKAARAEAEQAGTVGALPDPEVTGDPVPESTRPEGKRDPAWCERDELALMLGEPDAATGHRVLPLRIVNIGDRECGLQGYPDVVFGDQNGHLLETEVARGGFFMAEDPGPEPLMIPASGTAVAYIGWKANSTHGALVAATVHAAPLAGDRRDSWEQRSPLDIVAGSEVSVTAWELVAERGSEQ